MALVEFNGVNKYYGDYHALRDINLSLEAGQVVVLLGPSGSGKSTLIRTINALESIDSGSLVVNGHHVESASNKDLVELRKEVGMVFQHFNLYPHKTVLENITLAPMKVLGLSKQEAEKRAKKYLSYVNMWDRKDSFPAMLSGGQKQRVGIARALVHHPEILLCDEATSALDPESTSVVLSLLKEINQKLGITIVLITHEMQVIRDICDEVVVIDHGEIVESGAVWSVFSNPQQQITQELLNLEQLDFGIALNPEANAEYTQKVLQIEYAHRIDQAFDFNQLLQKFQSPVQVLQSHIDQIQDYIVARLVIAVASDRPTPDVQDGYKIQHLQLKELGYARSTV